MTAAVSTTKVLVKRWPDSYTLIGPPLQVRDIDEASDLLAQSPWLRNWVAIKIKEAFLAGETFTRYCRIGDGWRGRDDGVVAEWRLATDEEVFQFVDESKFASMVGHAVTKKMQSHGYTLRYHEGAKLIKLYDSLPRQAKVILDLLNETGRENFTEASITMVLAEHIERLSTKQEPRILWGFYRRRLIDEGHLEEVEDE